MSLRVLTPLIGLLLLSGCVSHPRPTPPAPVVRTTPATPPAEPVYGPFPAKTLESLLLAEFAGHRQRVDIALGGYVQQALLTRDPGVVARASTIAQLLNQPQSQELSRLWTDVEPDSAEAWYVLALSSLRLQQYHDLIPALDRLLALRPEADLEQMFLSAIPTTPAGQQSLLKALEAVEKNHQDSPYLLFARALVLTQAGTPEPALTLARRARALRPESPQITLLEAKILSDLGHNADAARLLADAVKLRPDSQNLRLNYARSLVRARDMQGAEREFGTLVKKHPDDDSLRLALALIALENHHDTLAHSELSLLTDSEEHAGEAYFYLGKLAQRQGKTDDALSAYANVPSSGPYFLQAQSEAGNLLLQLDRPAEVHSRFDEARLHHPDQRIPLYQLEAELLSERKQPDGARAILDEALRQIPGNTQLLLSRALVAERQNQMEQFEADIRAVLQVEPDNASALNALGYTLLERTPRMAEAAAYIQRAHTLRPDDPAILDSLGWLRFKQGDVAAALQHLRHAFRLFADDEIAAHLGEVLWVNGQHHEARQLWQETLRQHPGSDHILRTRLRLDP
jgi:tetratricopeptide (TPR) repeat protein